MSYEDYDKPIHRKPVNQMTTFVDGPAQGQSLMLSRAAIFLRVVELNGVWDGLDQPEDAPAARENVYAYQIVEYKGHCFIDGQDKSGKRTGWRAAIASFRLVTNQPTDTEMRSTFGWRKWCEAEAERQKITIPKNTD